MKKVKITPALAVRLKAAATAAEVSLETLVEDALERELKRLEKETLREEIAALEIRHNILEKGQELEEPLAPELSPAGQPTPARCELCLKEISPLEVDGPFFCPECAEIARGPDLTGLDVEL